MLLLLDMMGDPCLDHVERGSEAGFGSQLIQFGEAFAGQSVLDLGFGLRPGPTVRSSVWSTFATLSSGPCK